MSVPRKALILLRRPGELLLGRKKRAFGAGRVVAPGGGLGPQETAPQAALREAEEEVGLRPAGLKLCGELSFVFPYKPGWGMCASVFTAQCWTGDLRASDELEPRWYALAKIPYAEMWPDAVHWLPKVLAGEFASMAFEYGEDETLSEVRRF